MYKQTHAVQINENIIHFNSSVQFTVYDFTHACTSWFQIEYSYCVHMPFIYFERKKEREREKEGECSEKSMEV